MSKRTTQLEVAKDNEKQPKIQTKKKKKKCSHCRRLSLIVFGHSFVSVDIHSNSFVVMIRSHNSPNGINRMLFLDDERIKNE